MGTANKKGGFNKRIRPAVVAVIVLLAGLYSSDYFRTGLGKFAGKDVTRQVEGQILGVMPHPLQPDFMDPALDRVRPKKNMKKVVIKRIPRIQQGAPMRHPNWGDCVKCHLLKGGPPAGSQWASPFGKVLEKVSTITKVGPPILPNSTRPHPAAGRCIKCHDIVIEAPV